MICLIMAVSESVDFLFCAAAVLTILIMSCVTR
jgi:hypothetical protein